MGSRKLLSFSAAPPWGVRSQDGQDGSGRRGAKLNCRLRLRAVPGLSPKLTSLLAVGVVGSEDASAWSRFPPRVFLVPAAPAVYCWGLGVLERRALCATEGILTPATCRGTEPADSNR